jgi:polyhydroxyalkanoate synthesis regulator phasin
MDTLSLIVKSSVDKAKNSVKTMINTFQQYSNVLDKTKQSMQGVANATNTTDSNFNKSKQNIDDLTKKLEKMKNAYRLNQKAFEQRPSGMDSAQPFYKGSDWITDTTSTEFITQKSLNEEKAKIDELEKELKELRGESDKPITPKVMVPKDSAQGLKNIGKEANDSRKKVNLFSASMSKIGGIARSVGSKGFDFLKNKFKDFTKGFSKSVDGNVKEIRKLALGLIGVRTAMSVLTKSVNAYLSFDSALQDSLTNSWNMLGSLLAPAIEFVARMFALATNYIAQFVNALTGINLVARANAKSLQTQAKATKGVGEAQRGLLGMDEITNLPTEPGGGGGDSAPQIQMDDSIKSFKALDDILQHLKDGQWHLVGEDIARGINKLLYSINWKDLKRKAYRFGYNFGDFLNGLFEVDWSKIGSTFAETLNTWTSLVRGFVDKFSFIQLGKGLGNMLTKSITDVDWVYLAETINKTILGIFSGISTFLRTADWGGIGQSFAEFVKNIDWGGILIGAIKISILSVQGFREFLVNFMVTLFWDVIEPVKEPFIAFGDFIYGGINELINTVVTAIGYPINYVINAFRTLVNTVKSLIHGDLLGSMKHAGKGIANAFISPINRFINGLNTVVSPIADLIKSLAEATGRNINIKKLRIPNIPTLATGTPNIETEGLYHLHEGEMVVPKRYNPNTDGYDNGSDNREIIDLLVSLNASMLEYAERPININMDSRKVAEATYDDMQQIDRNRNKSTAVVRS